MSVDQRLIPEGKADDPRRIAEALGEMIEDAECIDDVPASGDKQCNVEGCGRCELMRVRDLMAGRLPAAAAPPAPAPRPMMVNTIMVARAEAARLGVEAVLNALGIAEPPNLYDILARALPPGERMRLTSRRRQQRCAVLHDRLLFLQRRVANFGDRRAGRDHHEMTALEEALARWDELPRVVAELHRAEALLSHLLALPAAEREAEIEEMRSGAPSTLATLIARAAGALADVDWNLRYGELTTSDRLVAAEVVTAWQSLLALPRKKRDQVIAALRRAEREAGSAGRTNR